MQFWKISVIEAPSNACAFFRTSPRPTLSVSIARAKNLAPAPSASLPGTSGVSIDPAGVEGDLVPMREVGEY
jgi:hypothetical protein